MARKHIALLSFAIIIVFFIARESGVFDSTISNYRITRKLSQNLKENTLTTVTSKAGFHTDFGNQKYSQTDIFIRNIGEKPNQNEDYGLEMVIEKIKIPFSLVPFYTNIDYEYTILIDDNITAVKDDSKNISLGKRSIKGNMTLTGNFTSYGLLSNKEVKRIITKDTEVFLKQELRKYLDANP
jgi:hypothetical protein